MWVCFNNHGCGYPFYVEEYSEGSKRIEVECHPGIDEFEKTVFIDGGEYFINNEDMYDSEEELIAAIINELTERNKKFTRKVVALQRTIEKNNELIELLRK